MDPTEGAQRVRLLIWILGVICTLHALMTARAIAPAWAWVFWVWMGLWLVVGVVVLVAALVRAAAGSPRGAALRAPAPQSAPIARTQGGE
jgi:hypothetical protein